MKLIQLRETHSHHLNQATIVSNHWAGRRWETTNIVSQSPSQTPSCYRSRKCLTVDVDTEDGLSKSVDEDVSDGGDSEGSYRAVGSRVLIHRPSVGARPRNVVGAKPMMEERATETAGKTRDGDCWQNARLRG
ncbi:hypothetical protein Adt_40625 [Abeliophyllum distichum]|uniref:Uncharacterized protein n=1 Tax=Abeliophyllum distichum TaxID=126358 RepID=A0ABD1Q8E3_9LAMI